MRAGVVTAFSVLMLFQPARKVVCYARINAFVLASREIDEVHTLIISVSALDLFTYILHLIGFAYKPIKRT